jgi:hypothetical protein
MNNSEKNRLERERLKTQKELYKANKAIRDKIESEKKEIELKEAIEKAKIKKPIEKDTFSSFASISLDKLKDNNISDEVSLSDMMGIKKEEFINENNTNLNEIITDKPFENADEKDRHYAPDFI